MYGFETAIRSLPGMTTNPKLQQFHQAKAFPGRTWGTPFEGVRTRLLVQDRAGVQPEKGPLAVSSDSLTPKFRRVNLGSGDGSRSNGVRERCAASEPVKSVIYRFRVNPGCRPEGLILPVPLKSVLARAEAGGQGEAY